MLFAKIFGVLFLCSLAATDMITFKPFVKSRYSLRGRRAKSTTKAPITKSNETVLNYLSTESDIQSVPTKSPTQNLETTTKLLTEKQFADSIVENTEIEKISTPAITTSTPAIIISTKLPVLKDSSTPASGIVNLGHEVSGQGSIAETKATKKMETTTQTEWVYDYYASDDENQKKK